MTDIDKKLTEDECLKIGGHCYEVGGYDVLTNPPISHRVCKHCGHTQHGVQQPNVRWTDARD